MTETHTAVLLRNWEKAMANALREILAAPSASGVAAASTCADMHAHTAPRHEPEAARPRDGEETTPAAASSAGRTGAFRLSPVTIATSCGHEDGVQTAPLAAREDREDGREAALAVRGVGGRAQAFATGRSAGCRVRVRRLHSEPCWCRQIPVLSIEWVVDVTGPARAIGSVSMALALALDDHLPVFAGGLAVQNRFHGLVERPTDRDSGDDRPGAPDACQTHRLLFSSILVAD